MNCKLLSIIAVGAMLLTAFAAVDASAENAGFDITDDTGKTVHFDGPAEHIAVNGTGAVLTIADAGVVDKIVEKFLNLLKKRLEQREIAFDYDDKAVSFIHRNGYDRIYGARPLRRYIQNSVETPLATELLKGRFQKEIHLTADEDGLKFTA